MGCDVVNPLLGRGFAGFGRGGFCLLQGQRDGGVEEFEGAALNAMNEYRQFVREIPKSPVGKVLRRALKESEGQAKASPAR